MSDPIFFTSPAKFRAWLVKNHKKAKELWVGYHKKSSGKPTLTWPESVDEALCFGWIDGIRYSHDETSYKIRFTPRNPKSVWSKVNVAKMAALTEAGKMLPEGTAVFELRDPARTYGSAIERHLALDENAETLLRANRKAWAYFEVQPPGYRRIVGHWIMMAKRPETRAQRIAKVIEHSSKGERLPGSGGSAKKTSKK